VLECESETTVPIPQNKATMLPLGIKPRQIVIALEHKSKMAIQKEKKRKREKEGRNAAFQLAKNMRAGAVRPTNYDKIPIKRD
jgi:hypothetical protein